jgi:hypothetical protein
MPSYRFYQVDVFTNQAFGGNPLAVFPDAEGLSPDEMHKIAKEMNLSETAFLHREKDGYQLRWFTPTVEVALCGHATLASAHVLVPTVDSAGKSKRPRDIRNGVRVPFPINPWTTYQVLSSPAWTMALLRNGMPITANLAPYAKKENQLETAKTMILRSGGSHTWDELKRLREVERLLAAAH